MSRIDRFGLAISIVVFLASLGVSHWVFSNLPHIEDEMAFTWQAKLIAQGKLLTSSPQPNPSSFLVPFVIDYQGKRFSKYPIGWPVVLSLGVKLRIRSWVNPLITGLALWFIYRTIKKLIDEKTALLAIMLGGISPFLLVNAGSLLSHPWSLFLTVVFTMAWLDAFSGTIRQSGQIPAWLPTLTAALGLGLLVLTRPWTAVAISIPFATHAIYIIFKRPGLIGRLAIFCLIVATISSLYLIWQYALTGSFFTNPYTLWWPYDQIGFGPGIGLQEGGFQLAHAWLNTLASLYTANTDLFGWPVISWLFLPFGLIALRKNWHTWLVTLSLVALVAAYALYWTHTQVFGPRYYYEGLPAVLMLTSAGVRWLSGKAVGSIPAQPWNHVARIRFTVTTLIVMALVSTNLIYYLPSRLNGMTGLSGISEKCITPLQNLAAQVGRPVLIFIHVQTNIHEYTCSLDLNTPDQQGAIQTAISRGTETDQTVASTFPQRLVFHYYPDTGEINSIPRDLDDPSLETP